LNVWKVVDAKHATPRRPHLAGSNVQYYGKLCMASDKYIRGETLGCLIRTYHRMLVNNSGSHLKKITKIELLGNEKSRFSVSFPLSGFEYFILPVVFLFNS